jgi:flagellar export protein FliJ
MAFRFSLATVLRLREIAEEREERLLGQILQQIAQATQVIADLQAQRVHLIRQREADLQNQMSAAELHMSYTQLRALEDKQKPAAQHLTQLENLRIQQLKIYEAAHRNRELLTGMREEQLDTHRLEQTKVEQSVMDDNFISRRRPQ